MARKRDFDSRLEISRSRDGSKIKWAKPKLLNLSIPPNVFGQCEDGTGNTTHCYYGSAAGGWCYQGYGQSPKCKAGAGPPT